jgi:hypothetical protein
MAYSKKTWVDSELITKEALNNMESGIEAAALKTDLAAKAKKVEGVVAITAANAAAAQPTQAEFNKVVADLKAIKAKLDAMNA